MKKGLFLLILSLFFGMSVHSQNILIIPDQIEPPIPGQTEPGIPDEIEPLILG